MPHSLYMVHKRCVTRVLTKKRHDTNFDIVSFVGFV